MIQAALKRAVKPQPAGKQPVFVSEPRSFTSISPSHLSITAIEWKNTCEEKRGEFQTGLWEPQKCSSVNTTSWKHWGQPLLHHTLFLQLASISALSVRRDSGRLHHFYIRVHVGQWRNAAFQLLQWPTSGNSRPCCARRAGSGLTHFFFFFFARGSLDSHSNLQA